MALQASILIISPKVKWVMFSGHCSFLPHSRNLNVWTTRCECVSESVCPETTSRRGRVLARRLMGLVPAPRSWFWISKVDGRTRWIKKTSWMNVKIKLILYGRSHSEVNNGVHGERGEREECSRSEVRYTEARSCSEREHKVTSEVSETHWLWYPQRLYPDLHLLARKQTC